ncbi:MAG: hypothetical protein R2706_11935 [Acidimicrobiales bacterium]
MCPDKIDTTSGFTFTARPIASALPRTSPSCSASIERPEHWVNHFVRTRDLQAETGGFTEFVGLPFVHMASPIYLQHKARRVSLTFRETSYARAVARIAHDGLIDNIQSGWVKIGS